MSGGHGITFPPNLRFGREILVSAEAVRLVAETGGGYREQLRSRGYAGNQRGRLWTGDEWPGAPVDVSWEPAPRAYPLSPPATDTVNPVRVRRILAERPSRGIIVGSTRRVEGQLTGGSLAAPNRTIRVLEVALRVPSGRARLVLAHPKDVQPVPCPQSRSPMVTTMAPWATLSDDELRARLEARGYAAPILDWFLGQRDGDAVEAITHILERD